MRELSAAAADFEPIGRIVGNYNNIDILKKTKIISGDNVIIPRKPSSISIIGEVMTPGSIMWNEKYNASKYIDQAAGFTDIADKNKIFIIQPNGKATKLSGLWGNNSSLKPGSIIIVPRRIELASLLERISSITSVIYQLTLSIAGIDNIINN